MVTRTIAGRDVLSDSRSIEFLKGYIVAAGEASIPKIIRWVEADGNQAITCSDIDANGGPMQFGRIHMGSGTFHAGARIDYNCTLFWTTTAATGATIALSLGIEDTAGPAPVLNISRDRTPSASGYLLELTSGNREQSADVCVTVEGSLRLWDDGGNLTLAHTWNIFAELETGVANGRPFGQNVVRLPSFDLDLLSLTWITSETSATEAFMLQNFSAWAWPSSSIEERVPPALSGRRGR